MANTDPFLQLVSEEMAAVADGPGWVLVQMMPPEGKSYELCTDNTCDPTDIVEVAEVIGDRHIISNPIKTSYGWWMYTILVGD